MGQGRLKPHEIVRCKLRKARLAVDKGHQRKGLGQDLLKDALLRTAQAADIAGIRGLLVHAKDDAAWQ